MSQSTFMYVHVRVIALVEATNTCSQSNIKFQHTIPYIRHLSSVQTSTILSVCAHKDQNNMGNHLIPEGQHRIQASLLRAIRSTNSKYIIAVCNYIYTCKN